MGSFKDKWNHFWEMMPVYAVIAYMVLVIVVIIRWIGVALYKLSQ